VQVSFSVIFCAARWSVSAIQGFELTRLFLISGLHTFTPPICFVMCFLGQLLTYLTYSQQNLNCKRFPVSNSFMLSRLCCMYVYQITICTQVVNSNIPLMLRFIWFVSISSDVNKDIRSELRPRTLLSNRRPRT
jgi:hypothetical protein